MNYYAPNDNVFISEEQNGALKQKIMIAVAILNIIAGIFLCVGVSYYASEVLSDYNDMSQILQMKGGQRIGRSISGDRYVYGQCLFLGKFVSQNI